MSQDDLMSALGSHHILYDEFLTKIKEYSIINIYTVDNELIKLGGDSELKKTDVIKVTRDYISINYATHITDVMFTAIKKIEYF